MTELKEKLTRIRAIRGGNRGVITKLINEAEGLLKEELLERGRLNTISGLLKEKLRFVKELDEKIIEICEVVDISSEIDEAEELVSRVLDTQRHIFEKTHEVEDVYKEVQSKSPDNVPTNTTNEEPAVEQQHSEETVSPSQPESTESAGTVNTEQNSININNNNVPVLTQNR